MLYFVGELATAIRNESDLRFGLYHSLYEWFNPMYLSDKANNFETNEFVQFKVIYSALIIMYSRISYRFIYIITYMHFLYFVY